MTPRGLKHPRRRLAPDHLLRPPTEHRVEVDEAHAGQRLDRFLAMKMPWRSRTAIQRLLDERRVTVDGEPRRRAYRVRAGQTVVVPLPPPDPDVVAAAAEEIPLEILYEDDAIVVLNKPPGVVVHPVGRKRFNTLLNALHRRYRRPDDPARDVVPTLCHRLDRDTSGVLVVAKGHVARRELYFEFDRRRAVKEYLAIAEGEVPGGRREIDLPIGPDERSEIKLKRAVRADAGRGALTVLETVERLGPFSLVRLWPRTGKQHQLRVHMAAIGCPILCDALYGRRRTLTLRDIAPDAAQDEVLLERQALHAARIQIRHPLTGAAMVFEAPVPADFARTLAALRRVFGSAGAAV